MKNLKIKELLIRITTLITIILITGIVNAQITGSGTLNYIPRFTGTTSIGNTATPIFENGSGIGIGTTSPAYKLDVNGDINFANTNALRINGNKVLWHNGNTADLFVGISAGNATMSGHNNTLIGYSSGSGITTGHENTFMGYNSGLNIATGYWNCFMGYEAGKSGATSSGWGNVAIGYQALLSNTTAYGATCVGLYAGKMNTTGCGITAIGEEALRENTIASDNIGIGEAALHVNTTANDNVAMGLDAISLQATTALNGGAAFSTYNVAIGNYALHSNQPSTTSNGMSNTALGHASLYTSTTGTGNTASGYQSSYSSTSASNNVLNGYQAGYSNVTGSDNTFVGYQAGYSNTTIFNTFMGYKSGYATTSGQKCTFVGEQAGSATTTGGGNSSLGAVAGITNTTGTNNTFLGLAADAGGAALTDATAIGYNSTVPNSHEVWVGSTTVTVFSGTVAYTGSDRRFKENVQENVKGLDFINRLRPVTYQLNTKKFNDLLTQNMADSVRKLRSDMDFAPSSAIIHSGFIAQEVEQAAKDCGFTSSIVHAPTSNNDPYALAYSEIVVPLVKAVQELNATNEKLQTQIKNLQDQVNGTGHLNNSSDQARPVTLDVTLSSKSIVLNQNQPNPFAEQTTITFFIPDNANNVKIIFTDPQGNVMKEVAVTEKGKGQMNVYAQDLSTGTYTYTLVSDGVTIDSKKMVCNK